VKKRFFYWLPEAAFLPFREKARKRRLRPMPISGVPCKTMHPLSDLSFVPPETWNQVCRRQGSWYRTSPRNGHILLVSPKPVSGCLEYLDGMIEQASFQPETWVTPRDIQTLISDQSYLSRQPEEWLRITLREKRHWRNLLERVGDSRNLEDLIGIHSANHANFIRPVLFLRESKGQVPHSIGKTADVCSACIELFNILGEGFGEKYVMPCPGYVAYARGEPDRFLKVTSGEKARRFVESLDG